MCMRSCEEWIGFPRLLFVSFGDVKLKIRLFGPAFENQLCIMKLYEYRGQYRNCLAPRIKSRLGDLLTRK